MRSLQFLLGMVLAVVGLYLSTRYITQRPIWSTLPDELRALPWSDDPKYPARIPTSRMVARCRSRLDVNDDLLSCLRRLGMRTGRKGEDGNWAEFEADFGLAPVRYHLFWHSADNRLPLQIDGTRM